MTNPTPETLADHWMQRCYTDLTARLTQGEVRRAYGRDTEVAELLRLLASPLPRHPVLLGRSGVGKSALAMEAARLIHDGSCPPSLRGLRLLSTSPRQMMGAFPPGNGWQSSFSELWEQLQADGPFLLLLHNAHEAVGMGARDSEDPDLASALTESIMGSASDVNVRILAEARGDRWGYLSSTVVNYTRLFVPFRLEEPEDAALMAVLESACRDLEGEHSVLVTAAARQRAVDLTRRYVVNAAMPGKALALLEETMAAQSSDGAALPEIDSHDVTARFANQTGLPMVLLDERELWDEGAVRSYFQERVLGQELAVEAVLQRLSLLKAGIHDPNRPLGVFLFIGPTGVGKTELTKTLARFLFGKEERLVRINMADYSEYWQFTQLFGSPDPDAPIEVQRGQLTTRLGDQSFTVLLLDEFEKAYPNIFQRFLQLFDEGVLINGAGEEVNLRNSIIILTSNLAADMRQQALGFLSAQASETMEQRVMRTAEEYFTPEFVNRIDQIVFFHPLSRATMRRIGFRELQRLFQREGILRREIQIEWDDNVVDWIVARGYSERFGARYLRRQIEKSISYPIAKALVSQRVEPGSLLRVYVRGGENGQIEAVAMPSKEALALGEATVGLSNQRPVTLDEIKADLPTLRARVERAAEIHRLEPLRARRDELLAAISRPDFWDQPEGSQRHLQELGTLSARVELIESLMRAVEEADDLLQNLWGRSDRGKIAALGRLYSQLTRDLDRAELDLSFVDAFDPMDAWLTVQAGGEVGGDGGKWAAEMVKMYLAWAKGRGFEAAVVDESVTSDGRTLLYARLRFNGHGAFALLRGENGVHRLVEAAGDRGHAIHHARVSVWPQAEDEQRPLVLADLTLEGRAISEKGQFLKRLRSRVTVTHRPSGHQLESATEGSLHETEAMALALLRGWLVAQANGLEAAPGSAPWGDVVRTYQRHREQGVRDLRTGTVIRSIRHVLSGRLDPFLMAALAQRAQATSSQ